MPELLTPIKLLTACAVMTIGSALQGSVGFGLGVFTVPILALIDPSLVPSPLFCGLVLTLLMSYRERQAMDVPSIKWRIVGMNSGRRLRFFREF